jgi:hypothetical protein
VISIIPGSTRRAKARHGIGCKSSGTASEDDERPGNRRDKRRTNWAWRDPTHGKVTFINFNCDRAIERFIYFALQERASATPEEAANNHLAKLGQVGAE